MSQLQTGKYFYPSLRDSAVLLIFLNINFNVVNKIHSFGKNGPIKKSVTKYTCLNFLLVICGFFFVSDNNMHENRSSTNTFISKNRYRFYELKV